MTAKRTDNTAPQRSKRYIVRQKERGLVRAKAWVPEDRVKDLLEFAKELREHEAKKAALPAGTDDASTAGD